MYKIKILFIVTLFVMTGTSQLLYVSCARLFRQKFLIFI